MSVSNVSIKFCPRSLAFGLWSLAFGFWSWPFALVAASYRYSTAATHSKPKDQRPKTASFVSQRHQRIHLRCSSRRNETGEQSDDDQTNGDSRKRRKISGSHTK